MPVRAPVSMVDRQNPGRGVRRRSSVSYTSQDGIMLEAPLLSGRKVEQNKHSTLKWVAGLLLAVLLYASYSLASDEDQRSFTTSTDNKNESSNLHETVIAPECTAELWSVGSWVIKDPPLKQNGPRPSVFEASGFDSCAHTFKPEWYLGVGIDGEMSPYRWNAAQWKWKAAVPECENAVKLNKEKLIQSLVEDGGWLLIGDSMSEEHFFSLSCVLAPHVRVAWGSEDLHEQHIFLRTDSSIIPTLDIPVGYSIETTPLITQLRSDHGFSMAELQEIYTASNLPEQSGNPAKDKLINEDKSIKSNSIDDYFHSFISPHRNYQTLIFSTALHWTLREFSFPNLEEVTAFYGEAVKEWVDVAAKYLDDEGHGRRRVLVRSSSTGHDDCHKYLEPLSEVDSSISTKYNWAKIPRMNDLFREAIDGERHPRISFLSIDKPSLLRPDSHTVTDCLHISVGAGVIEGWTAFIAYYLSWTDGDYVSKIAGRIVS